MKSPQLISLRDGRTCPLDRMRPEHAEAYRRYQTELAKQTRFISTQAHEVKAADVLADQAQTYLDEPDHLWLVALDGESENIVGDCMARVGGRERMRHVASIGVGVLRSHQRQGLARNMMSTVISWAQGSDGIFKLQLSMFEENAPAERLYASLGFVREGVRPGAFRQPDGTLHAEVLMGRWIGDEHG